MYPNNTAIHQYFALVSLPPTLLHRNSPLDGKGSPQAGDDDFPGIPQLLCRTEHPMTQGGFQCLFLAQQLPWGKSMGADSPGAPVSPGKVGISRQGCRQITPELQAGLHCWSSQVQLMYLAHSSQSWTKTNTSVPILETWKMHQRKAEEVISKI